MFGWGFATPDMGLMVDNMRATTDLVRGAIGIPYQQFGYTESRFFVNSLFPEIRTTDITERPAGTSVRSVAGDAYDNRDELQSFFGRVNYSLMDKYLFTATLRADGSTRFGGNNKYGYFPSAAVAWRLSDEEFVPNVFHDLKLRLGYGITGNQEIPHNLHQQRQRYGGIGISNDGGINVPGTVTVAYANPDLTWEQTSQTNFGLDFEFLGGRLGGSFDLYRKVTTDLLIRINTAQPAPQPFVFRNLDANVINSGVELMLNWYAINTTDFGLTFSANGAYNKNIVEDYDGPPIDTGGINGQGLSGAFAQRIANDQPLYSFFLREYTGIDSEGQSSYVVDAQQFVGKSPLPLWNVGFNTNIRYKQWDLAAYMYGQLGHYVYNNTANAFFTYGSIGSGRNITVQALEEARAIGESPANTPDASTRYLEKADFFRMQNLNLGYTANVGEGFVKGLRVSFSAQNLFVITNYSGLDPEVNVNKALNDVPSAGIDYTSYPRARTYTLGLNVTF
jgi:TonB-dependent starch-binding outer membrane protein SusC